MKVRRHATNDNGRPLSELRAESAAASERAIVAAGRANDPGPRAPARGASSRSTSTSPATIQRS